MIARGEWPDDRDLVSCCSFFAGLVQLLNGALLFVSVCDCGVGVVVASKINGNIGNSSAHVA